MFSLTRWVRSARYGQPIVIVSGLPRSGTSMMMRMLQAGGLPVASDGIRKADARNPHGYFEYERVKDLDKNSDKGWLHDIRGKSIKVISFLLRDLPDDNNYDVIFLRREIRDVMASQEDMLRARGTAEAVNYERMAAGFADHLTEVRQLMSRRSCFRVLYVDYAAVIDRPLEQAGAIARFVNRPLDTAAMAAAVDSSLRHHKS